MALLHRPALLVLLALFLRLVWALFVPVEPVSDSHAYLLLATNIADHGTYAFEVGNPTAYWAVGTAAIYAAGFWLFGVEPYVVVGLNLIASLVCVWLLYHLGRLYYSELAGGLAALLFAIWPVTIQFVTTLNSELFFMALSLGGLAAWEAAKRAQERRWLWLLTTGAIFAAATYVRPIALLIPVGLGIFDLLRRDQTFLRALTAMCACLIVMGLLVAPWTYRNSQIFDETVLISTNFGANFWMGNHAGSTGGYEPLPGHVDGLSEPERSRVLQDEAMSFIRQNPEIFAIRTLAKALELHERETIGVAWNAAALESRIGPTGMTLLKLVSTGYWYMMLCGALLGMVLLWRTSKDVPSGSGWRVLMSPPFLAWLYFTSVHAIIVVEDRYHMPSIPFIAMLCAGGFSLWQTRFVED